MKSIIKFDYKPSGNCPVQSEGKILGYYFYFRARWASMTLEICESEKHWEDNDYVAEYCNDGFEPFEAGWQPQWKCLMWIYWWAFRFSINRLLFFVNEFRKSFFKPWI
jgi:hypothetical protein